MEAANGGARDPEGQALGAPELNVFITAFDVKRLEAYANNMVDYHVILDLLPTLATLYFKRRLIAPKASSADINAEESTKERSVKLSAIQSALLLAMGLQRKTIEEVGEELGLEPNQVLAQLLKVIKKNCGVLQLIQREDVVNALPAIAKLSVQDEAALDAGGSSAFAARMNEELEEAAEQVRRELRAQSEEGDAMIVDGEEGNAKRARQREFINSLDLSQ